MAKPSAPISSASSHDLGNRDNLPGLLNQIIKKFIQGQVDNSLPAIVVSFDKESNRVVVQPLIKILRTDGKTVSRGTLTIPVFSFGTKKMSLRFNLVAGDLGWIEANDRDISLFLQSLNEQPPNTLRQHEFSDAIFYPDAMRGMDFTADAIMSNEAGTVKTEWFSDKIVHTAPTVDIDGKTNLGITGQVGIARLGDTVEVTILANSITDSNGDTSPTSNLVVTGTIISASSNNKAN